MPTKKARLQIILADEATEQVKALAEESGRSVSEMRWQRIHAALRDHELQRKPDLSQVKGITVEAAIRG